MLPNRDAFRAFPLDGALLLFRPRDGASVRVTSPRTRALRRRAPRVVSFGLSHACNLRCGFCSRDASIADRWDTDQAATLLETLASAGTQEVAFGGGEPLAFRGFESLLERLHRTTSLALHVTTNGTLVDAERARRLAPFLGEVRVSVYEHARSLDAIATLHDAGVRVCANLLVTPHALPTLPLVLQQLAAAGARDVALLRYVGDDASAHLEEHDLVALEACVRESPLPVKLSRCFADRLSTLPRLFGAGGDCGAGRDFVVIDPDRRLRSCSFHVDGRPFDDAEALLAIYADTELTPAPRRGCARPLGTTHEPDGVRSFRSFASNNSGDTVLVAHFETAEEPAALAEALQGLESDVDRDRWRAFLESEGVPTDLVHYEARVVAMGKTLLATGYDSGDALSGLRAVTTRRGACVVEGAVHVHELSHLLVAASMDDVTSLEAFEPTELVRHGATAFATFLPEERWGDDGSLTWEQKLVALRGALGDRVTAELVVSPDERLLDAAKRPLDETVGWAWLTFPDADAAARFHSSFEGDVGAVGNRVLVRTSRFRARLGRRVVELGGTCTWFPEGPLTLTAWFSRSPRRIQESELREALESAGSAFSVEVTHGWPHLKLTPPDPLRHLPGLVALAHRLKSDPWLDARPTRVVAQAMARTKRRLSVPR